MSEQSDNAVATGRVPSARAMAVMSRLVNNAIASRMKFLRGIQGGRNDIDDECGYPKGGLDASGYQVWYDGDAIANRVAEVYPLECWQVQPEVYEDENEEHTTEFEDAVAALNRQLRDEDGEESYYQDAAGSPIMSDLLRADIACGIGRFGITLLGLDDSRELDQPAVYRPGQRLLFMEVLPESLVRISDTETSRSSPRFGRPTYYEVTLADPAGGGLVTNAGGDRNGLVGAAGDTPTVSAKVHWTRVVHNVDNLASSKVLGIPRMQTVLPQIINLRRLYGGSTVMYWNGALPGLSIESDPSLGGDIEVDVPEVKDEVEQYLAGLQRVMFLNGLSAKSLAPQVVDPSPQMTRQIEAICIKLGIPVRVFKGSERGELASTQDDDAWNDRLRDRQNRHVTPRIIIPFFRRLINLGVLPRPKGFSVFWPDITSRSEMQKAQIVVQRTAALANYVGGGVINVMALLDYLTKFMNMTRVEAETIVANAKAEADRRKAEELRQAKAMARIQAKANPAGAAAGNGASGNGRPPARSGGDGDTGNGNMPKGSGTAPPNAGR
jgi:hypothetical protein